MTEGRRKVDRLRDAVTKAAFYTGAFDEVTEALHDLSEQAVRQADRSAFAAALDQLALVLHMRALDDPGTADVDREERYFQQALTIRRELGEPSGIAESLFHLGLVHQVFRNDWTTAISFYSEALDIAEPEGEPLLLSEVHRHIGLYYAAHENRPDVALRHFQISQNLRLTLDDPGWSVSGLAVLGRCELALGMVAEAQGHLRESVRLARTIGIRDRYLRAAIEQLRQAEDQNGVL